MIFLSTLLISMFITIALIPIFRTLALRMNNGLDIPNERKVHVKPVPKVGGIAMAIGALVPMFFMVNGSAFARAVMTGAWIIVLFGFLDDVKNLGYRGKFAGQLLAALVVIIYGDVKICSLGACLPQNAILPDVVAIPLTLITIVGVTNAINLSDGLDGLAGGGALLIFICIGYLAYLSQHIADSLFIVLMSAAVVGAIFGFLRFNTFPAVVFMGDTGSQLLGFLAVTLALGTTRFNAPLSPFLPLLLLGFPILDTLTVMAERIASGHSPFRPDRNHFHHRLMRLGLYHSEAVVMIYFITAVLVTAGFILRYQSEWFLLAFYLVFSGLIISGFTLADRRGWKLQRYDLVDRTIKGRLRVLKDKHLLIKAAFPGMQYGLYLLLIITCLLPATIPGYLSWTAMGLAALGGLTWKLRRERLIAALRIGFYLTVPVLLWFGQADISARIGPPAEPVYNLASVGLALLMVVTLKFTRRTKGFKTNTMDFLIIVIALVVPNLPDPRIQSLHMGFLATKIIVMFFGFEVLVGELRGQFNRLGAVVLSSLVVVAVRGLLI
jgi:UDP-GlcNAc:undecaprenyl-phosphate GlcNAc-1-phosphate transferase